MTVFLLLACSTPQSLATQAATAECKRSVSCDEGGWDTVASCKAEKVDAYRTIVDCYTAACSFDRGGAYWYLRGIRSAECGAVSAAANDLELAFVDCDNAALGECLLGF